MISSKIVIVDDDRRIIDSLKAVLFEYELITFSDGESALKYLSKPHEVHLVILDVCMKGLNGLEVLERIKKLNKDMAVIMLTGQATQDIIIESLRYHADDFLEKPFDVSDLKDRIKNILKSRERYDITVLDRDVQAERIRQFIERNYANVSLEAVASELCLSPKYVGQLFIGARGEGFRKYKLKVRMEQAQKLLRNSSLTISSIAHELGYENPESFMRTFKTYYHKTPKQYRQELKKGKT